MYLLKLIATILLKVYILTSLFYGIARRDTRCGPTTNLDMLMVGYYPICKVINYIGGN